MLKHTTYKEKFVMLAPWMPKIMDAIKRDLRNEHLKQDPSFVRHYFAGKNPNKLTVEELTTAYSHNMANGEKSEELGEFICNRWLLKNSEIYQYFEQALSKIDPDFQAIEQLERAPAMAMMEESVKQFGAPNTYIFCVINSVVFPEEVYKMLAQKAEHASKQAEVDSEQQKEHASVEAMKKSYEQQIARLTDKYEKKLQGLQKKYSIDVETLKKQVANLQRKLNA